MVNLAAFNSAPRAGAEAEVLACCESTAFARKVAGGRPYPDAATLLAASDAAIQELTWDGIVESLNAHPRIGDRTTGQSAAEQSGAAAAGDQVRRALAEGNIAYEKRFGYIFLICASGLSGQDMLTQLQARLGNEPEAEQAVVRTELAKITRLRMTKRLEQ
ncbi:MAG: 2-oxo-4-hydroxy-4-carboxy-5-ureidoimidazoline decarboxylase [Streptosporangiaceae bacterium]